MSEREREKIEDIEKPSNDSASDSVQKISITSVDQKKNCPNEPEPILIYKLI